MCFHTCCCCCCCIGNPMHQDDPINSESHQFCSKLRVFFFGPNMWLLSSREQPNTFFALTDTVLILCSRHLERTLRHLLPWPASLYNRTPNRTAHSKPMNRSDWTRPLWTHPDLPPFPTRHCQPDSHARVKCRVFFLSSEETSDQFLEARVNSHHPVEV